MSYSWLFPCARPHKRTPSVQNYMLLYAKGTALTLGRICSKTRAALLSWLGVTPPVFIPFSNWPQRLLIAIVNPCRA